MNDNILYHLVDLDIRAILQEEADHLIETLDIPETQVIELTDSEDLLDTHTDEVFIELDSDTSHEANQTQLRTPSITPSMESSSLSSLDSIYIEAQEHLPAPLPAAPGNRAS